MSGITIDSSSFTELRRYYNDILNTDRSTYKSSNDEPTPIDCITEMIGKYQKHYGKKATCLY
jgi:hypothetical protein